MNWYEKHSWIFNKPQLFAITNKDLIATGEWGWVLINVQIKLTAVWRKDDKINKTSWNYICQSTREVSKKGKVISAPESDKFEMKWFQ